LSVLSYEEERREGVGATYYLGPAARVGAIRHYIRRGRYVAAIASTSAATAATSPGYYLYGVPEICRIGLSIGSKGENTVSRVPRATGRCTRGQLGVYLRL
jgi:hypothetical protein